MRRIRTYSESIFKQKLKEIELQKQDDTTSVKHNMTTESIPQHKAPVMEKKLAKSTSSLTH